MPGLTAVSYTHLDVYKRQLLKTLHASGNDTNKRNRRLCSCLFISFIFEGFLVTIIYAILLRSFILGNSYVRHLAQPPVFLRPINCTLVPFVALDDCPSNVFLALQRGLL